MKYVKKVKCDGYFLELVDGMLFATANIKSLALMLDHPDPRQMRVFSVEEFLQGMLPSEVKMPDAKPVDTASTNNWCIISCNSLYDPNETKNHWVPGVFREQVSNEEWFDLTAGSGPKVTATIKHWKSKLHSAQQLLACATDDMEKAEAQSCITQAETNIKMFLGGKGVFFGVS